MCDDHGKISLMISHSIELKRKGKWVKDVLNHGFKHTDKKPDGENAEKKSDTAEAEKDEIKSEPKASDQPKEDTSGQGKKKRRKAKRKVEETSNTDETLELGELSHFLNRG